MRPPMLPVWAPGCGVAALAPLAAGELEPVGAVDAEQAAARPIANAANRVVARIRPVQRPRVRTVTCPRTGRRPSGCLGPPPALRATSPHGGEKIPRSFDTEIE